MYMLKYWLGAFVLFCSVSFGYTQTTPKAIPSGVMLNFETMYPSVGKTKWAQDSASCTVIFKYEGKNMKAVYSKKGYWKYTGESISIDSIPTSLMGFVKEYLPGHKVESARRVETPFHKNLFELEISHEGKKYYKLYNPEGVILE
jgi:hypothetical protein